jgi:hypothetical protein
LVRFFFVLFSLFFVSSASEPTERLAEFRLGTNVYRNVTLTERSAVEALVRFDGGVRKVNLSELPEPLRSKWYDEKAARDFQRSAEDSKAAEDVAKAEAVKRGVPPSRYYLSLPLVANLKEWKRATKMQ